MILYLVRHGESSFNAEGRIQGQLDVPLSELGRRQASAVADGLGSKPIEAVYCSPLIRARDTAVPLASALGVELISDDRLKEVNIGIFQGLLWSEVVERYPAELAAWKSHDPDYAIPQGESRRQLMQRGVAALESIWAIGHAQVAVVAHGGVLTAALRALLGVPPQRSPFSLYNASISLIEWNTEFRLMTLNQLDHLHRYDATLISRSGDL